jgi:tetratricopeptide (TPR) repeat protein
MLRTTCALFLLVTLSSAQRSTPAQAPAPGSPADLVQQGEKLSRAGKQDEALALYSQALDKSPGLYEAHLESGIALDLKGDYAQAQEHFTKAIELAPAESKQQALRAMAFSYTFAGDAFKAAQSETQVFNARLAKNDSVGAAETCNELARIYLELGDPDHAYKWYKMGYETAAHQPDLSEADKNLWLFRWENAQARIAARRGNAQEAQQHVLAAKAALDNANNPDQARFYPYLTGYVAFYGGDYKTAIAELQKADQRDPFILALLGQAYEKSGDATQAKDYYRRVLEINTHNPTNAFARPLAKKKLEGGGA